MMPSELELRLKERFSENNWLTRRGYGIGKEYKYVRREYDEKGMEFLVIELPSRSTYDIPMSRCRNAAQCLDWIHQLHVKTWFDEEREKEFIDLLFKMIPDSLWSGKA